MKETTAEYDQAISLLNDIGYPAFVRSLYNRTGDNSKDLAHAVLGVITECHELLAAKEVVNAVEEMGDILFYCIALHQVLEDAFPGGVFAEGDAGEKEFDQMVALAASGPETTVRGALDGYSWAYLDIVKRWVGYGKEPSLSEVKQMLVDTALMTDRVASAVFDEGFQVQHVLIVNVCKLMERYKGTTFSKERAVNRDIAAERDVLDRTV